MFRRGHQGEEVRLVQTALRENGFNPGETDGIFGPGTEAALLAFQRSEGLTPDGTVGPSVWAALSLPAEAPRANASVVNLVTVDMVSDMFPGAPLGNIKRHLPNVLEELRVAGLSSRPMVLMALATICAETAGFAPISERPSRYNTSPSGEPFDLYDYRKDLGNRGPADGADFRGRGFIQLTGRANYGRIGHALGMGDQLLENPELANDSNIAARILAAFLREKQLRIKTYLLEDDLKAARRVVNGGTHGMDRFSACYRTGQRLLPENVS
ncbi:MAG: peptidoglycan-binding protein [Candidatus Hydrogenedentes bacterium]|nr:peptidoglycan-binding protein [Candidatus Hydrogenedentota bacterium]